MIFAGECGGERTQEAGEGCLVLGRPVGHRPGEDPLAVVVCGSEVGSADVGRSEEGPPAVALIGLPDQQALLNRAGHQPAGSRLINPQGGAQLAHRRGVQQGATAQSDLDAALAPFAPTVRSEVLDLVHQGWAAIGSVSGAGTVALTVAGRAVHDRVAERVRLFRAQVTAGFSEQDYTTLLTLLKRVAGNLTPA
jgi:hypothetical protein